MAAPALRTRPPTGKPAVPAILVEGPSKSGRTVCVVKLSESPLVDRFFVAQIGTGAYDDYGYRFPKMELLDHNGTTSDVLAQLEAACAVKAADGKLNVIVVDDGTVHWDTHKLLAEERQRRNPKTRAALAENPDAEVDPTMDKWNDVKARWVRMYTTAARNGVVFIMVCRAGEVAKVDGNGNPVAGQTVYRVEAEKSTVANSTMVIRMSDDGKHTARLVAVTSLEVELPKGGLVLDDTNPIHDAITRVASGRLWADGASFVPGATATTPKLRAKQWVVQTVRQMYPDVATDADATPIAGALWTAYWKGEHQPEELTDDVWADLTTRIPEMIRQALAAQDQTPAAEADPTPPAEPDAPADASGDSKPPCPICGQPFHLGACPIPEQPRAQVGGRARRTGYDDDDHGLLLGVPGNGASE